MDIVWSSKAINRLREIINYYKQNSNKVALQIFEDIKKAVTTLEEFPYIASIETELSDYSAPYRSLIVRKIYKIIYLVDSEKQTVYIITIWDCRKNPSEIKDELL